VEIVSEIVVDNVACGYGEDNNMTEYRWDMPFTRKKMKTLAREKGLEKPYKFQRIDLHWEDWGDEGSKELIGFLELHSNDGKIIRSEKLTWMSIISEESANKYYKNFDHYDYLIERSKKLESLRDGCEI